MIRTISILVVSFAWLGGFNPAPVFGQASTASIVLNDWLEGLDEPVHVAAPSGDSRVFVVERGGRLLIVENHRVRDEPVIDIRIKVLRSFVEQGLLSVAFHPNFGTNGRFYLYYTAMPSGTVVISEFTMDLESMTADIRTEKVLLRQPQFAPNHNGGQIAFGPDGYLYAGLGDGGGAGDPARTAQKLSTLLGKIIRLNPDGSIPSDNPFVDRTGARGEIWAYGLRNPWRFSFDRENGGLWIADVGQNQWEEIDWFPAGKGAGANLGWSVVEGDACFRVPNCTKDGTWQPVLSYAHDGQHCSVTGGFVYRGSALPQLRGVYIYADFCSGVVRGIRVEDRDGKQTIVEAIDLTTALGGATRLRGISSFGEDGAGEILIVFLDGRIGRVERAGEE